jgi:hypothetical protein
VVVKLKCCRLMVIMVEDHWLQCQPLSKVVIIVVIVVVVDVVIVVVDRGVML